MTDCLRCDLLIIAHPGCNLGKSPPHWKLAAVGMMTLQGRRYEARKNA